MTFKKTAQHLCISASAVFLLTCPVTTVLATGHDAEGGLATAATNANLTQGDLPTYIGVILKGLFGVLGVLFLALMLYGGIRWMMAQGTEKEVTEARSTLINATIGLVVVAGSYALTNFVIENIIKGVVKGGTP